MESRDQTPNEPNGEEPTAPQHEPTPRRLLRSRDDRVIGGLCGGLGRYFGIDPIIFRIAAIALVFLGGAGVLVYVAGLLLVPSEPAQPGAEGPDNRNRTLTIVGVIVLLLVTWPLLLGGGLLVGVIAIPLAILALIGLLVWWLVSGEGAGGGAGDVARRAALGIGVLIVCGLLAAGAGWAAAVGGGAIVAGLVIAAGVALVAAAFVGGARWLILPALSVALGAGFVSAAGIDLDGGVGERDYRPGSAAEIRDRYELGMGQLTVDLRGADLPAGDTDVRIDLGIGEARLLVPEDVCVATKAEIGMGAVQVFDRESGGVDVDWEDSPAARAGGPRVVVDADVGLGAFHVRHTDFGHRGFRDEDTGDNGACAGGASAARGSIAARG